ncbi:MAG: DUF5915 domain-containing protein, partial [Chloroflexota bacterium]|nr:DUF5915 domain-containing protein [Chloroflexota bacterium]
VLDNSLTPELVQEGLVRDFVRGVQDARKNAGYAIEQTIAVSFQADPEVSEALQRFDDYVAREILAVEVTASEVSGLSNAVEPELVQGPAAARVDGVYVDQIKVGDHQVRIAIQPRARQ